MITSDPWTDFWVQLGATIIGAFLGFWLAILWERKKNKSDLKEIRNNVIESILQEIQNFQTLLKGRIEVGWNESDKRFIGDKLFIDVPAYKSAINSGNFLLLPSKLQTKIGEIYVTINRTNTLFGQLDKFYTIPVFTSNYGKIEADRLSVRINTFCSLLLQKIDELIPDLKSLLR